MALFPRRYEGSGVAEPNAMVGSLTRTNSSSELFNGWGSTANQNDYRDYYLLMEAGRWKLTVIYTKNTDGGIITPSIGGNNLTTIDTYGSTAYSQIYTATDIVISTAGLQTLRFTTTSKHASSSGYVARIVYWCIERIDATTKVGTLAAAPQRIDINPWSYWSTSGGGTATRYQDSAHISGGRVANASPTQNSYVGYLVALQAGTWDLTTIHYQGNANGIYTISLTGLGTVHTVDGYNAGAQDDQVDVKTGISIASDGIYELRYTTATKNASSSNYYYILQWIALTRQQV